MSTLELLKSCYAVWPELILCLTICLIILSDMFVDIGKSRRVCGTLALAGAIGAVLAAAWGPAPGDVWRGMIAADGLTRFFKLLFLTAAALIILFSMRSREIEGYRQGEYFSLLLGAVLGASFLVASTHFIMLVLALETLSMCSYVLSGYIKHARLSAEASLKYLLFGAVTSGVMLFGISYLYGMSGTLSIPASMRIIAAGSAASTNQVAFLLALTLMLAGLGFKMAMVPFHFWCPDVYQGSPTPVTAFLSVVSKAAGFGALLRVLLPLFEAGRAAGPVLAEAAAAARFLEATHLPLLFGFLSVATMAVGNLVALRQTDVKRLLAYSSIAHAGYLLMPMTVYRPESVTAILFYFFIYLFMNLGAFWVVVVMVNRQGGADLTHFSGAFHKWPLLGGAMIVFLFSLTGLPPTAGFVAKLRLFEIVVGAGLTEMEAGGLNTTAALYFLLALIGVLNSAVSLYYYMKIVKAMVFDPAPDIEAPRLHTLDWGYAALLAVPTLGLMLNFTPVLKLVNVI